MKTPYFIENIDWTDLRTQKTLLLETITKINNRDSIGSEHSDGLEGILALIDALQDFAVDEMDVNPIHVFDFELEEERDAETPEEEFARENAQNIFEIKIEGEFLYESEDMPKEFIEKIVDDSYHADIIKAKMRQAILEDLEKNPNEFQRDENGKLTYDAEMMDYGYVINEHCLEEWKKDVKIPIGVTDSKGNELSEGDDVKTVCLCDNCGSDNVQTKMWVNVNDNTTSDSASDNDNGDNWCLDCETHPDLLPHTLKSDAKVVGFQVVGEDDTENEGEILDASFCIYNLSQAREMLNTDGNWRLLTIWEGDIEEPTYMFEGNPRN